jgi:hypothetical protein
VAFGVRSPRQSAQELTVAVDGLDDPTPWLEQEAG